VYWDSSDGRPGITSFRQISSVAGFFYKYLRDGGRFLVQLAQAFLSQEKSSIEFGKMHSSLATVLVALTFCLTVMSAPQPPTPPPYLNSLAQGAGKLWFGTAADIPGTAEQTDPDYLRILENPGNFGEITPANIMKVRFLLQAYSQFQHISN